MFLQFEPPGPEDGFDFGLTAEADHWPLQGGREQTQISGLLFMALCPGSEGLEAMLLGAIARRDFQSIKTRWQLINL